MTADPDRWQRVQDICDAALSRSGADRAAFIRSACGDDLSLRVEVDALLANEHDAADFLSEPLGAMAARVIDNASVVSWIGRRIGAYEVLSPLGAGGMGEVYRARDTELGREVAIKVLPAEFVGDRERLARFEREARVLAALNHPHIGSIYGVERVGNSRVLVLELVDGETLEQRLARGPISTREALAIARQIAEALEAAHEKRIVHRDLKPANIKVTPAGLVKILDFGLAKPVAASGAEPSRSPTLFDGTRAGMMLGTPAYMSPEQARGQAVDTRTDIWAFGCVLYEMLTGRVAFPGATVSDHIAAILEREPDWTALPKFPGSGIRRLLERCLEKEAARRIDDIAEVRLQLEDTAPARARSRSHRTAWLGGAAALVAVAATLWWSPISHSRGPTPLRLLEPVQLTTAVGVEDYPVWSPDGRTLAYAGNPIGDATVGNWDIWVTQRGGSAINRTADDVGRDQFPSWSPDSTQIAFWSDREGGGCFVMPALAGPARRVAKGSAIDPNPPQWSADGTRLACVGGEPPGSAVEIVSARTSQVETQIPLPGDGRRMFLAWSRDEKRFAIVAAPAGLGADVTQLWVVDVRTRRSFALTDGRTKVWSPSWSSDGRTLYYVDNVGGNMDLWEQSLGDDGRPTGQRSAVTAGVGMRSASLSLDGRKLAYSQGRRVANVWRVPVIEKRRATWSDARQLTFDQAYIEFLDVSHDGTRLAVSSDRAGNHDLWILGADGGAMQQLTTDPTPEWGPRWSPDDSRLAFFAFRTGNREMWTMPAAGGPWTQLTDNPGPDLRGAWSPDGRDVAHLTGRPGFVGLWVTPSSGGEGRPLAGYAAGGSPSDWSPDGRHILIGRAGRIAVANTGGVDQVEALSKGQGFFARYTPDGSRIYFVGGDEGSGNLWTVLPDGTDERPVTDFSGRRGSLGVSALATDGRYLYFTWEEDLGDVWTMNVVRTP